MKKCLNVLNNDKFIKLTGNPTKSIEGQLPSRLLLYKTRMVYICCATGCLGNYDSECKVKIFCLSHKKYSEERERLLKAVPWDNIPDTPNTFICADHWPKFYEIKGVYGKPRPLSPSSVFTSCVKPSLVPTRRAPPRPTKRAHSSTRNTQPEKTEVFIQNDGIASYKEVKVKLNNITEPLLQTMQLRNENFVVIQSVNFIEETGIPKFTLKINHKLTFVSFYSGNKCLIKPLSSTGMTVINSVSKLEVAFRYLNSLATSNKQNVTIDQVKSMR